MDPEEVELDESIDGVLDDFLDSMLSLESEISLNKITEQQYDSAREELYRDSRDSIKELLP